VNGAKGNGAKGSGATGSGATSCLACGGDERFLELRGVPVFCNVLWPDRAAAQAAPRGDLDLGICADCGHVYNLAFDPELVRYAEGYENSLHHSPRFQAYAEELALDLRGRHGLDGKHVVEIACGQGDFLKLVCAGTGSVGTGFDPSYRGGDPGANIAIRREYFGVSPLGRAPDLVCSRHALEHMDAPAGFVRMMREAVPAGSHPVFFCEVPNSLYSLRDGGVWDFIYEHVSYFNARSLAACFARGGLRPTRAWETFAGQFLCLEAVDDGAPAAVAPAQLAEVPPGDELLAMAAGLGGEVDRLLAHWRAEFARIAAAGGRVAVWGSGSKGVTFLNLMGADGVIGVPVDINPAKHGLYLPGVGRQVVAPDALPSLDIALVLVMNPVYAQEIEGMVRGLGLQVPVVAV
jgi:hypothetical protein